VFEYSTLTQFRTLSLLSYVALCLSVGTCVECLQDTARAMLNKHSFWLKSLSLVYTLSISWGMSNAAESL
jgi:hypothetical protein